MTAPPKLSGLQARRRLAPPGFAAALTRRVASPLIPLRPQRQVLSLARQLFRAARAQPAPVRAAVAAEVRAEFARYAGVARGDVARVEHLLRRGAKQLDLLRSPHFKGVQQMAPPPAP